jgi:transposase
VDAVLMRPNTCFRLQPVPHKEIHILLDNISARKTSQVEEFLKENSNAKLHFTLTYSSWLNQVEIWFAKLEREALRAASSLRSHNLPQTDAPHFRLFENSQFFKWKYSDVRRRIRPC